MAKAVGKTFKQWFHDYRIAYGIPGGITGLLALVGLLRDGIPYLRDRPEHVGAILVTAHLAMILVFSMLMFRQPDARSPGSTAPSFFRAFYDSWRYVWLSWLILYALLACREWFTILGGSPYGDDVISRFLINPINNLATIALMSCYHIAASSPQEQYRSPPVQFWLGVFALLSASEIGLQFLFSQPHTITDVRVHATSNTASVEWRTDKSTRGFVDFGRTNGYGNQSGITRNGSEHMVTLFALEPAERYSYRIGSIGSSGDTLFFEPKRFQTSAREQYKVVHTDPASNAQFLHLSDNSYKTFSSDSSTPPQCSWSATFKVRDPLKPIDRVILDYSGKYDTQVVQSIRLFHWQHNNYVEVDQRSVGTVDVPIRLTQALPSEYISEDGYIKLQIGATGEAEPFSCSANHLNLSLERAVLSKETIASSRSKTETVRAVFGLVSGVGQGAALALLVLRLATPIISQPWLFAICFAVYAAIQGAFSEFDSARITIVMTSAAMVLKGLLWVYMRWLLESGWLLVYFESTNATETKLQLLRQHFIAELLEHRESINKKRGVIDGR